MDKVVLFEEGDLRHFSFEVGPIPEEIAFMVLIEFVPNFLSTVDHVLVVLFGDDGLIFGELFDCF